MVIKLILKNKGIINTKFRLRVTSRHRNMRGIKERQLHRCNVGGIYFFSLQLFYYLA